MSETDRELLELAAKACGLHIKAQQIDADDVFEALVVGKKNTRERIKWNPLTDDGDCARMEAALRIECKWEERRVIAQSKMHICAYHSSYSDHAGDKRAARRMASVRVAAAIGKDML